MGASENSSRWFNSIVIAVFVAVIGAVFAVSMVPSVGESFVGQPAGKTPTEVAVASADDMEPNVFSESMSAILENEFYMPIALVAVSDATSLPGNDGVENPSANSQGNNQVDAESIGEMLNHEIYMDDNLGYHARLAPAPNEANETPASNPGDTFLGMLSSAARQCRIGAHAFNGSGTPVALNCGVEGI